MGEIPLLNELAIVAALGVLVTVVLARLRLPTVAGLLAAGALMGPYGFGLVTSVHDIEVLAEVGVVLLLFTIGLEFSLDRMRDIFRQVALGGVLQVGLTFGATFAIARALGQPLGASTYLGFAVALSSTAIVLRTLAERQELDAPHGRFIVGTLIFQDLCVVPMVLIIPLLSRGSAAENGYAGLWLALGKAALVVIATIALARFVVPKVLGWVDASRSREVFLLAILTLCIGTAWMTSMAGLSLALGAFLGGMVVADTEYGHRAMSDILPLKDAFVSIFFVVLGMLFDGAIVLSQPLAVFGILFGLVFAKALIATVAALAMRFPARAAWLAGLGLAQFGEFGFVLTKVAQSHDVVDAATVNPVLAAGILSMFLTPVLARAAPHITAGERLLAPLEKLFGVWGVDRLAEARGRHLRDHIVLVGFGVGGQLAARALHACNRPVVVLEMNIENVRRGKALGLPVYYGDATSEEALRHARLPDAKMMVLLVNDPQAAKRIVDTASRIAPGTPVLMRTRYLAERSLLFEMGARDVVAEEVEGAVEVISRMLRALEIPGNVIHERIDELRRDTQTSERKPTAPRPRLGQVQSLDEMKIETLLVRPESLVVGRSPRDLDLRNRTGALVVGVRRAGKLLESPDPDMPFASGDHVFLVGTKTAIERALAYFEDQDPSSDPSMTAEASQGSG